MYEQYYRFKMFLMACDVTVSMGVFYAVVHLRPYIIGKAVYWENLMPHPSILIIQGFFWHLLFVLTGLYDEQRILRCSTNLGRFTLVYALGVMVFSGILYLTFRETSRIIVVYFAVINYIVLLWIRMSLASFLNWQKSTAGGTRTIIIGTCDNAVAAALTMQADRSLMLKLVGFVDEEPQLKNLPAAFLGITSELTHIISVHNVEMVVVARSGIQMSEIEPLVRQLESLPVRIYLIPDLLKLALVEAEVETFGKLVVIGIREPAIRGNQRSYKRALDLVLSFAVILFTWPFFILIALAIKLDSKGPVIYVSKRVGENGRIFNMYKFRTMYWGADLDQAQVAVTDDEGRTIYKTKDDPRISKIGAWLRSLSLDELPQVFNVIAGDMSWVGPRPEQPFITEQYEHWQWQRVSVPPGITGWWQVSGRSDLPMHLNTEYDVYYVKNYSIFLDLRILLKTVGEVLKGTGAY
jgi:exopolysaccharide biosynthesis polyprenyl glycosylphosphotransferase